MSETDSEFMARLSKEALDAWKSRALVAEAETDRLRAEVSRLQKTLEFVERWAVYKRFKADAAKRVSDEDAVATIANHPAIRAITERMKRNGETSEETASDNSPLIGQAVGGPYSGQFLSSRNGSVLRLPYDVPIVSPLSFDNLSIGFNVTGKSVKLATYKWDFATRSFIFQPDNNNA